MTSSPRSSTVRIALVAICILAFISLSSLCLTLFYKNYADPAILTAIISIASTLVGALAGMITTRPAPVPEEPVKKVRPKPEIVK